MNEQELHQWSRRYAWLFLVGVALLAANWMGWSSLLLSPWIAIMTGAMSGAVDDARKGGGLWIVMGVFVLMLFPMWLVFAALEVLEPDRKLSTFFDLALTTELLWQQVRAALAAMRLNWQQDHLFRLR